MSWNVTFSQRVREIFIFGRVFVKSKCNHSTYLYVRSSFAQMKCPLFDHMKNGKLLETGLIWLHCCGWYTTTFQHTRQLAATVSVKMAQKRSNVTNRSRAEKVSRVLTFLCRDIHTVCVSNWKLGCLCCLCVIGRESESYGLSSLSPFQSRRMQCCSLTQKWPHSSHLQLCMNQRRAAIVEMKAGWGELLNNDFNNLVISSWQTPGRHLFCGLSASSSSMLIFSAGKQA